MRAAWLLPLLPLLLAGAPVKKATPAATPKLPALDVPRGNAEIWIEYECDGCLRKDQEIVKKLLFEVPGVRTMRFDPATEAVIVEFDDRDVHFADIPRALAKDERFTVGSASPFTSEKSKPGTYAKDLRLICDAADLAKELAGLRPRMSTLEAAKLFFELESGARTTSAWLAKVESEANGRGILPCKSILEIRKGAAVPPAP